MTQPKPAELGYRMPAEWEPHEATWLSWPHNPDSWPGMIDEIPPIWAKMVKYLHTGEMVHINVSGPEMESSARALLINEFVDLNRVRFHHFETNDAWARDHGPIFIKRDAKINQRHGRVEGEAPSGFASGGGDASPYSEIALTNWEFNKWGGKYPPWDLDNQIPEKIADYLNLPVFNTGIVMEGGSLEVNGEGLLLTTESCLLNKNRNPNLSKEEIEQYLKDYLGVTHIYWLGDGIVGDDTDGHIDDLTRFTDPSTLVTVVEKDPEDANFKPLQENLKRLYHMQKPDGSKFRVVTLPLPKPILIDGQQVPASYANFYIGNEVVLVPIFNDPADTEAIDKLKRLFPSRRVIGIDSTKLIWGLGAFHCVTQQQPK